jgi:hypothetical protein
MPFQSEIKKIIERLLSSTWIDFFFPNHAPQGVREFDVDQMRRMQLFPLAQDHAGGHCSFGASQCKLQRQGSIQNHHQRRSLSSRRYSVGERLNFLIGRASSRFRISSSVGRSANFLISRITRSDKDTPSVAARTLSVLCSASGTFRSWIIFDMS